MFELRSPQFAITILTNIIDFNHIFIYQRLFFKYLESMILTMLHLFLRGNMHNSINGNRVNNSNRMEYHILFIDLMSLQIYNYSLSESELSCKRTNSYIFNSILKLWIRIMMESRNYYRDTPRYMGDLYKIDKNLI